MMAMKKVDRKEAYTNIISLLANGKNKEAFDAVRNMCGKDTSVFVLISYEECMEKLATTVNNLEKKQ